MKVLEILGLLSSVFFCFGQCQIKDVDLEDTVEKYVKCVEGQTGLKAVWWRLNGSHEFFEQNSHLKAYKVEPAYLERTFENSPKEVLEKETLQIFPDQEDINDGPTPITITFQEIDLIYHSSSTDMKSNLKIGGSLEVSGQVSFVSGSVKVEAEHESQDSDLEAHSNATTMASSREYILNPYSESISKTFLVKRNLKKFITNEIALYGYFAIAFSTYIGPENPGNYETIKEVKDEKYWKECGSGIAPVLSLKRVYMLPMGALADDVDFFKDKKNPKALYFHLNGEVKQHEERIQSRTTAKVMTDNQKKAYSDYCS